jgi:Uracil-DNA glycosylase
LALIGEAPGEHETLQGLPFVGPSGQLLWSLASKHGILRDNCFVGNICQERPPSNDIHKFSWTGPEISAGLSQLWLDLAEFQPHLCLLLGNSALRAFSGHEGISNWRGSVMQCTAGTFNQRFKYLPSIHPAAVLREYWQKCLLDLDLKLARTEAMRPDLVLPSRDIKVDLSPDEIIERLYHISCDRPTIAIDIEGYWNNITCLGIAESPSRAFVIPFTGHEEDVERRIMLAVASVLVDPNIPKILQNSLYDTFCLQYGYSIPVRGVVDDTMLAHWELYCELPKRLSFLSSIYTSPREPYWKDEREDEDRNTRLTYCGKDCCVTYECRDVIRRQLKGSSLAHYEFNLSLNEPLLYMEQKGILYDSVKAKAKLDSAHAQIHRLQFALDAISGLTHPTRVPGWVDICRQNLCLKRSASSVNSVEEIVTHSKTTCLHLVQRAHDILRDASGPTETSTLSLAAIGELASLTNTSLNVDSRDQIADYLYRDLCLPIQYKKEKGRRTEKETTDVLSLLTLYHKTQDPTLKLILQIRGLRTRATTLESTADPDGRIRCAYNSVGTETGRLTCYESPTGSGFNLQTVSQRDRDLFCADPDHWMFQCDLSGADGWTVAAHCKACGDPTMLEDLLAGLKIPKILTLISTYGQQVNSWSRDKIREASAEVDSKFWKYYARKRVQHGTNYGMKSNTMSDQIMKDSYKLTGDPVYLSPSNCEVESHNYLSRYPGVLENHIKIKSQLKTYGYITSASGHRRTFFGRRDDYDTFKQACADEPQNNTTYANNRALLNMWSDPSNRVHRSPVTRSQPSVAPFARRTIVTLRVVPLHQIHDAILGQFKKEDSVWAIGKIKEWFNFSLTIAGQKIVIPFEGGFGRSWGELKEGKI